MRSPSTVAVTPTLPLLLMASRTSLTVTAVERSTVVVAPVGEVVSVRTILPRWTPAEPLSSESAVSERRLPPPVSKVNLVAPSAEALSANPRESCCWVVTSRATLKENDPGEAVDEAVAERTLSSVLVARAASKTFVEAKFPAAVLRPRIEELMSRKAACCCWSWTMRCWMRTLGRESTARSWSMSVRESMPLKSPTELVMPPMTDLPSLALVWRC